MNVEEALQVLAVLTAAYPNANVSDETVKLYAKFLTDIPFEAGKVAALNLIAQSKWFPTIAELRQAALELNPEYQLPTPEEAWGEVVRQIAHEGYYGQPKFSNEAIEQAVKVMGWRNLCLSENPVSDRARFTKIYETYANRHKAEFEMLPEAKRYQEKLSLEQPKKQEVDANKRKVVEFIKQGMGRLNGSTGT